MIRGSDVTVVIPSIPGREDFLTRALRSLIDQQVRPGRTIVQYDGRRAGAAATRNLALRKVETPWVAFLDDDDYFLPNHLKVLVKGANVSGADLVYTYPEFAEGVRDPIATCDNHGNVVTAPINVPFGPQQEWWLRNRGGFIPVTHLARTAAVLDAGGFPEPFKFDAKVSRDCEDYGLLLAMLDRGARFHHVLGVRTWHYTIHDGNTGGRGDLDSAARLHRLTLGDDGTYQ